MIVGASDAEWGHAAALLEGLDLARSLVTEPANIVYPETFVARARDALESLGVEFEVLDETEMAELGMGALLGVAQGSVRPPRLLAMRWNGGKAGGRPVVFVGKGITFDTGGISIKPALGMEAMKWDMGGAGAVAGLMKAVAGAQGQGERGRRLRARREHAGRQRPAPGRRGDLHVRPDHRGDQHRRRRPARPRRRDDLGPAPVQA